MQTQSNCKSRSQRTWQQYHAANRNSIQIYTCSQRRARKSARERRHMRLVLVSDLIGWEGDASFFNQSHSVLMQNRGNCELLSKLNWKRTSLSDDFKSFGTVHFLSGTRRWHAKNCCFKGTAKKYGTKSCTKLNFSVIRVTGRTHFEGFCVLR